MSEKRKVLFIAANPTNLAEVDWSTEYKAVDKILKRRGFENRYEVKLVPKAKADDINEYVNGEIWLIHFCGHGKPDKIILEKGSQSSLAVRPNSLLSYIEEVEGLQCVLLNSCNSDGLAEKIQDIVDYSIGFEGSIENDDALEFVRHFYESFTKFETIPMAFRAVYKQLALENNDKYTVVFKCRNSVIMNAVKTGTMPNSMLVDKMLPQKERLELEIAQIGEDITRLKSKIKKKEVNVSSLFWQLLDDNPATSIAGILWFEENKAHLSKHLAEIVLSHGSKRDKQYFSEDLNVIFIALSYSLVCLTEQFDKSNFNVCMRFEKTYYNAAFDKLLEQLPPHYSSNFLPYFRDNVKHIKTLF
jgi:hypothetical protein